MIWVVVNFLKFTLNLVEIENVNCEGYYEERVAVVVVGVEWRKESILIIETNEMKKSVKLFFFFGPFSILALSLLSMASIKMRDMLY